jgi:hypothetical protein
VFLTLGVRLDTAHIRKSGCIGFRSRPGLILQRRG